jgi:hypothetical protein
VSGLTGGAGSAVGRGTRCKTVVKPPGRRSTGSGVLMQGKYNHKSIPSSSIPPLLKDTVSRDIAFYFKVYKFKSVLYVRPLMVFKSIYFVVL